MTSRNINGGDSVGTMYVSRMEEQVFYDDKRNRIRGKHWWDIKTIALRVRYIFRTIKRSKAVFRNASRNAMVLMSHQCFRWFYFVYHHKTLVFHTTYIHCPHTIAAILISWRHCGKGPLNGNFLILIEVEGSGSLLACMLPSLTHFVYTLLGYTTCCVSSFSFWWSNLAMEHLCEV